MRLMFLTLSPLSSNAGHLSRLKGELEYLMNSNEISILCLYKKPDDDATKKKYKGISFFHFPIEFEGWNVKDQGKVSENIQIFIDKVEPDLVVLQMEVWDLMRELGKKLKGSTTFAAVVHAMPFLVAPTEPTGEFKEDVIEYANSGIQEYRKDYVLRHFEEAERVFRDVSIIANNNTVAFYFNKYFKSVPISVLAPSAIVKSDPQLISNKLKYDFAYMARVEKGKGVEYLSEILEKTSILLKRKVRLAILGRTDDSFSEVELQKLLSSKNVFFDVEFFGWADDSTKVSVLPHSGVFLYPSSYDNYPTVVNEALSFGLPVVTWNVPFYSQNYRNTNAVEVAEPFNTTKFADLAVHSLENRYNLSPQAIAFINSFPSLSEVAKLDTILFQNLKVNKNE